MFAVSKGTVSFRDLFVNNILKLETNCDLAF